MWENRGLTLVELLTALALLGLLLAFTLPATAELRTAGRAAAAARELATTLHALRWRSVAEHCAQGLYFESDSLGWSWRIVRDGNGNGLRTQEIRDGTDPTVQAPRRVEASVSGVRLGFPPGGPFPAIPPRRGTLVPSADPVRFGSADIVAFSPLGTASSGTLYLTDGQWRLLAVTLFGPSARVRVWSLDAREGRWRL